MRRSAQKPLETGNEKRFAFGKHSEIPRSGVFKDPKNTLKGAAVSKINQEDLEEYEELEKQAMLNANQSEANMSQNLTVYKKSTSLMEFEDLEDRVNSAQKQ